MQRRHLVQKRLNFRLKGRENRKTQRLFNAACLVIIALAALIRFSYVRYGLPYVLNGDEAINFGVLNRMIADGSLNPNFFRYPSLMFYANLPGQMFVNNLFGPLSGIDEQAIGTGFLKDEIALVGSRATSVLCSLVAIYFVIRLVARISKSDLAGLVTGGFLILSPLSSRHAAFFTPDILATMFVVLSLYYASKIVDEDKLKSYVLAGIFAGLAASSKYNVGVVALSIPAAHFAAGRFSLKRLGPLIIGGVVSGASFIFASPFILLDLDQAWPDFLYELRHYATGHPGAEGESLIKNASWTMAQTGGAVILVLLALLGEHRRLLTPLFFFAGAYFVLLSMQNVRFERNILPLVPVLLVLAGVGAVDGANFVKAILRMEKKRTVIVLSLLVSLCPPAYAGWIQFVEFDRDPKLASRVWLEGLIPNNASLAIDAYSPYLEPFERRVIPTVFVLSEPVERLSNAEFVLVTRDGSERFLRGDFPEQKAMYDRLVLRSCLIHQFPESSNRPSITVFQMKC